MLQSNSSITNPYSLDVSEVLIQAGVGIATHSLAHARILMQLGYEPNPPCEAHTLASLIGWKPKRLCYPNIFKYWGSMRSEIGISGIMLTGLPARLLHLVVFNVQNQVLLQKYQAYLLPPHTVRDPTIDEVLNEIVVRTFARITALGISYPLYVVSVRQIAQIVGHEDIYTNIFQTIGRIYLDEGVLGFFGGFPARATGELLSVVLTTIATFAINKYILKDRVSPDMRKHSNTLANFLVGSYTYKFNVISTVMSVTGSKLKVAGVFQSSMHCYHTLAISGNLARGGSIFFRYVSQPY